VKRRISYKAKNREKAKIVKFQSSMMSCIMMTSAKKIKRTFFIGYVESHAFQNKVMDEIEMIILRGDVKWSISFVVNILESVYHIQHMENDTFELLMGICDRTSKVGVS
jgi:hypothetical protein